MLHSSLRYALLIPALLLQNLDAQNPGGASSLAATPPPEPATLRIEGGILRPAEGMPLGNGRFGVLVWGEGRTLRMSLDRSDLWDLRPASHQRDSDRSYGEMRRLEEEGDPGRLREVFDPPAEAAPHPAKLPGTLVEIDLAEPLAIQGFSLDLRNGRVQVQVAGAATLTLFIQVHAADPVVRVTGGPPPAAIRISPPRCAGMMSYPRAAEGSGGETRWIDQGMYNGRRFAAAAHWKTSRAEEGVQPVWTSVACALLSDSRDSNPRQTAIALVQSHADYYQAPEGWGPAWPRFAPRHRPWVLLPDARLQRQYELAAYLYRAGSAPGSPPMPLQGLWTVDDGGIPPLRGAYDNRFGAPMAYGPCLTGNLIEQGLPWIEFHWSLLPRYRQFARDFFEMPPGCAAIPGAMTLAGDLLGGWNRHTLGPTHGAWIAWLFYRHWRSTGDDSFLETRAAPFCAEIGRGLLHLLAPANEAQGALRLPLSTSPEAFGNTPRAWLRPNSNYDQALIKALLQANRHIAEARGDSKDAATWSGALARLEPFDVEDNALTLARGEPYAASHPRLSHAIAIHPLGLIDPENGGREIVAATLEQIHRAGTRNWTGATFAWFSALCARGGQGERALDSLEGFLGSTSPNGLHQTRSQSADGHGGPAESHFTLDGNFLVMDAIHEMLLQSRNGVVHVFPAVSERWREVSFANLRADGGFLVSARRSGGRTVEISVAATVRAALRMQNPFLGGLEEGESLHASVPGFDTAGPMWEATLVPGKTLSVRIR